VQDSGHGLVFTPSRAGASTSACCPRACSGSFRLLHQQLELALAQDDPRDRMMGLTLVALMGRSAAASRALYLAP